MQDQTDSSKSKQSGYAIVAAVWLAGLALLVASEFSLRVHTSTLLSANHMRSAELSSIASGMVRLTAWRLSNGKDMPVNGEQTFCAWNATTDILIAVQDHAGLVDLNTGNVNLYRILFEGLGLDANRARTLADEISDYRDVDSILLTGGTEKLLRNGASVKNAPFETVEEIDLLPSMSDDFYWKIKPLVTTMSGMGSFDPATAPLDLAAALSRNADRISAYHAPSSRRAFRIAITARHKSGTTYAVVSDVLLVLQPDRPFSVVTWNTPAVPLEMPAQLGQLQACFTCA
jgi:general secretion pathway protein K